jgi:hypothetical protein
MTQFEKLKSYLENNGVKVVINEMTNFVQPERTINIHHRFNKEKNGLYCLLHEAGHWLQNVDVDYTQNLYKHLTRYVDNDKKTAMITFIHELDAWNRGEMLAHELDLTVDFKAFDKLKQESLLSYFEV